MEEGRTSRECLRWAHQDVQVASRRENRKLAGTESSRKSCCLVGRRLKVFFKEKNNGIVKSHEDGQTDRDSHTCTYCTCSTRNQLWVALFSSDFFSKTEALVVRDRQAGVQTLLFLFSFFPG